MSDHVRGYPVSASTYTNYGCRCDGCRQGHSVKMQTLRQAPGRTRQHVRIDSRLKGLLVRWARDRITPDELEALRTEAKRHVSEGTL